MTRAVIVWAASAGLGLTVLTPASLAQARSGTAAPARAPAGANSASADVLEDKLMAALASREMDGLLDYYFKRHNVPADKQAAIKGIVALRQMSDPNIPPGRKRTLLKEAVKGVDTFIASTKDTEALLSRAFLFIEHGMKGQINQIEYFGESPARQAELNEAADAVVRLLDKAIEECEAQQNKLLAGQTRPTDALLKQWQVLEDRLTTARWTRAHVAYGLALSLDPANPKRKEIADAAIAFLKDFEAPEYQRQAAVRLQLGKLNLVKGDYVGAAGKFAEALKTPGIDKFAAYEAMYFTALSDLLEKRPDEADVSFDAYSKWVQANLSPQEYKAVSAGLGLLEYRIKELHAELARTPQEKQQFAEAGEAVLSRVMKENPAYEGIIKRMLLEKLPANADLTKLDTLLLRSLTARGVDEFLRAKDGAADDKGKPILDRAVQAARELEKRKGQPNVTDDVMDEAAFLEGMFLSKIARPTEAVEESLRYLKDYRGKPERVRMALDNALAGVEGLRKNPETATGQKTGELIDRAWATALKSGRKEYAFVYGKRLFDRKDYKGAVEAFKQVPPDHPALTHARFYQLSAMQELLDDKSLEPAARKVMVGDIQKLAAEVNQRIDADLAKATDEQKPRLRFYKVSSILLAADLMQTEMKNHEDVLKVLQGFEETARGLPREENLVGTALHLRVNSLMALGRTPEAVEEVKKLVNAGTKNSASVLYNMIQEMDEEYAQARAANDKEAMRANSAAQVALIGPLIEQTQDPKAKAAYEKWEAQLLLRAARNEESATKRAQYLTKAQGVFTKQLGAAAEGTPEHDNSRYQLALISYELKDYKRVQQEMGQLLAAGKLGKPDIREVNPDGTEQFKENPVYWEGLLRFMQANWEVAQADKSQTAKDALENSRDVLRTLYVNRGSNVGGKLAGEYQQLKAKLLPGFDENKVPATQASTAPAAKADAK
jgi:hypothetical protein